ncbi:MAG: winged helix-turn-helix domain-containing protein [Pseudomonadota bacterium]
MEVTTEPFIVGEWTVHPLTNELRRDGAREVVEPKLIRVLYLLALNADQVVANETIINEVWGQDFVGEPPVANAISRLRRALGCSASAPTYIMTERGDGYRLFSPVTLPALADEAQTDPLPPEIDTTSYSPNPTTQGTSGEEVANTTPGGSGAATYDSASDEAPEPTFLAFVSYARQADAETARWLVDQLRRAGGFRVARQAFYFDEEDDSLPGAEDVLEVFRPAVRSSRYFLLCLSQEAVKSQYIKEELREFIASNGGKLDRVLLAHVGEREGDIAALQQALLAPAAAVKPLKGFANLTGDPGQWSGPTLRRRKRAVDSLLATMLGGPRSRELRAQRRRAWTIAAALGIAGAIGLGASLWQMVPDDPITVASVPFVSASSEDELMGRTVARDTLVQLRRSTNINVISDSVSFPQVNNEANILVLAQNIRADYIIDGRIEVVNGRIIVTVTLVDATKDRRGLVLESGEFSASVGNFDELGPMIARAIAQWLGVKGSNVAVTTPAPAPQTTNSLAAQRYYAGIEFLKRTNEESNLTRAVEMLEGALALDSRYAAALAASCEAHLRLYSLKRDTPLYDRAAEYCNRALVLEPDLPQAKVSLGALYRVSDKLAESEILLESVRSELPTNADVLIQLAYNYRDQGRLADTEATLNAALKAQPGYWKVYSALGNFYSSQQRYQEALDNFRWVSELMPESAIAFGNLGATYFQLRDYVRAREELDKSIALEPLGYAFVNLGLISYYEGDWQGAVDAYSAAIANGADGYWARARLAEALILTGASDAEIREVLREGVRLAEESIAIDPSDGYTLAHLGLLHARLGEFAIADGYLDRARAFGPKDPDVHQIEASARAVQGDAVRMCESLRNAITLGFPRASVDADPDFAPLLKSQPCQPPLPP